MEPEFDWQVRECDDEQVKRLSKELGVSQILAKILIHRNLSSVEKARAFLNVSLEQVHNPFLFKDMDLAVARVIRAIRKKEKICIYGDYDVDGAVATALLILFFRQIGRPVDFYIPNRLTEGYSLNEEALAKIARAGTCLVITVDNGIMANREIARANALGLDVIVTDHHEVGDELPPAVAVINPQRKDCNYPFKGICGAGVAFKLIMALRQRLREEGFFGRRPQPNIKQHLDLLAIATVCDVVPLVDENRYFVKEGLRQLAHSKKPGVRALLSVSGVNGELTTTDLGFRLGPRINACGRLKDAALGVKLLISNDVAAARKVAGKLNVLNQERRDIESQILKDVFDQIESEVDLKKTLGLVVFNPAWHLGIVGIVASRVVERFGRPAFVLTTVSEGLIKGSGRSAGSVSLIAALRECAPCLKNFGGHEAAAGVTLTEARLPDFKSVFDEAVKRQMSFDDLKKRILVDDILEISGINERLMDELKRLEPHGMGNARPVFATPRLTIQSKRIVGQKHLKLTVGEPGRLLEAIAFKKSESFHVLKHETGAIFGLEINNFRNVPRIQLVVRDFFKTQ